MVSSLINPSINYPVVKHLEPSDKDKDSIIYKVKINNIKLLIAVGNKKDIYLSKGVVYYPIYLIYNNKVVSQIGLYEIDAQLTATLIGDDSDVDISHFKSSPIFYPYVSVAYLKKYMTDYTQEDDESLDESLDETKEKTKVKKTLKKSLKKSVVAESDKLELDASKPEADIPESAPWIQKFMDNTNYNIIGNEGGGDCLFIVISSALKSAGVSMSVADLRKILADNANEDLLQGFQLMFNTISTTISDLKKDLEQNSEDNSKLQKLLKVTKDREQAKSLISQGEELKKKREIMTRELKQAKENIKEFIFMKDVDTLDSLRAKIHTSEFWGETWSISTLEKVLNIKLILFSKESYDNGDMGGVLQCGQLNDDELEKKGTFIPRMYVLCNYLGAHYELITFNGKKSFDFGGIPTKIKNLVVEKCMERNAGPYYLIPDFRDYARKLKIDISEQKSVLDKSEMSSDLYDNDIVFQFYSKSNKGPLPGKGSGEKIPADKINDFKKLASIPDWRKKLSNFWKEPFSLDGKRWASVEHYYQGSKYKKNNPEVYNEFSLDSGSELSQDAVMAKGAGGKKGSFKGKRIIPKGVVIDPDFFSGRSEKTMEDAMMAKFSQNADLREMLLETKNAKLVHFSRGSPPIVFNDLMRVRASLAKGE